MKNKIKLENWSLTTLTPFSAPEMGICFSGNVFNHPGFTNGDFISTSRIIDFKDGGFLTQSGNLYFLGEVNKDYEIKYPNAFERLKNNFIKRGEI